MIVIGNRAKDRLPGLPLLPFLFEEYSPSVAGGLKPRHSTPRPYGRSTAGSIGAVRLQGEQRLLNRISLVPCRRRNPSALPRLLQYLRVSCSYPRHHPRLHDTITLTLAHSPHSPLFLRRLLSPRSIPERRFSRIQSSRSWRNRVAALSSLFLRFAPPTSFPTPSRILCVFSGAGHLVAALRQSGVIDVTGVDLIDFPACQLLAPTLIICRSSINVADPGFSSGLAGALFPARLAGEPERTVRKGGGVRAGR
ncbi:hypothetical protein J5N97_000591 [Dioscorea zingiberensis]|uniref:Uncharacterized protein n=1 Tax=Dioscorea zingiberensis TaxID=325984 RepID=A0A9D5H175_9LILI|nr:hypothetical protein J5N97_000591 [Dioscorea zingiberensis]